MTAEELEAHVAAFLERRETEPDLTPESFAASHRPHADMLAAAIRTALDIERTLTSSPAPHRTIGGYVVRGELGRGGMGVVYRVERDGREFALKLLPLAPLLGPRMLERFRREAVALARIAHPHIVRVHDSGIDAELPYLVMDLVEGQPLDQAAGALSVDQAIAIAEALARALHAAHQQGVLHRDLKPQNVMLRADGEPVLLDFGLSALEEGATLTGTGDLLGTPRYMAPEQLSGELVDARTDVHALGLLLYELTTGHPAHSGHGRDALYASVRFGRITPARAMRASLSGELEAVIHTALARRPEERYADALAFADDLARLRAGTPVAARPLPEAAEGVTRILDQALRAWLAGDAAAAAAQLAQARLAHPDASAIALLEAHLASAARRERAPEDSESLEDLAVSARIVPGSAAVHRAMASTCRRLGRLDDATRALGRALAIEPDDAASWTALAEVHLAQRAIDEGLAALDRAEALSPGEDALRLRLRGAFQIHRGDQPAAQALLRRALELAPDDAETRYRLAYSLDSDHAMAAAAPAYERVLEVAPAHVHALLCLANLFAGASRGRCRRCDEFYAEHPEHLDPARAEHYLLRAIDADRGADDWATRTARDIALQLEDRRAVIALLTRLTRGIERTPAVLRLEEALRRVELLAG